ncbi:DUF1569 domain-containing protein [Maribacter sp. 2304DJ31-5]|uniref:DUF1569 domain-containing protein n=1 Tax=Maribacter sp. 2304DJ31-5 TaxID=3386273 RepID=UPI0039BD2FD5
MKNIFDKQITEEVISRIENLKPDTQNLWGKMNSAQMMAHCNVAYDLTYTDKYPKPTGFKKFMIKLLAKNLVVGPKPYKKNMRTAPEFLIHGEPDFNTEKDILINNLIKTQELGEAHFEGKDSHAFGPLTASQWNTLFYKHLNHHLEQFGI